MDWKEGIFDRSKCVIFGIFWICSSIFRMNLFRCDLIRSQRDRFSIGANPSLRIRTSNEGGQQNGNIEFVWNFRSLMHLFPSLMIFRGCVLRACRGQKGVKKKLIKRWMKFVKQKTWATVSLSHLPAHARFAYRTSNAQITLLFEWFVVCCKRV